MTTEKIVCHNNQDEKEKFSLLEILNIEIFRAGGEGRLIDDFSRYKRQYHRYLAPVTLTTRIIDTLWSPRRPPYRIHTHKILDPPK